MQANRLPVVTVLVLLFCVSNVYAAIVTLTPEETLRVEFITTPPFNHVPDTLELGIGMVEVLSPYTYLSSSLYDDTDLLGTDIFSVFGNHTGMLGLYIAASWKSPESLSDFFDPAVIDFTSIRDGSIQGIINFTIATGAIEFDLESVEITATHATDPASGHVIMPKPVITSVQIVPEPGSMLLLGLGGILLRKRK